MAEPMDERSRHRLMALLSCLLLAQFLLYLATEESVHPAVWMLAIGLAVAGGALGVREAGLRQVGAIASRSTRRLTGYGIAVAVVVMAAYLLAFILDADRTGLQDVVAVAGTGVATFCIAMYATVFRRLPATRSE